MPVHTATNRLLATNFPEEPEWTLVTLACNLRRLHRLGADLKATPTTA